MRILIVKAPPMLRSILKSALGALPDATIEEAADDATEIEAKLDGSNVDLAVLGPSISYRDLEIKNLLRRAENLKVLVIDEQGHEGRLYYLHLRKIRIRDLSISAIRQALTVDERTDGL